MMRAPVLQRTMPIVLVFAALAAAPCLEARGAADGETPRIAGCRVGFDGKFKVGCWTPVWVAVEGRDPSADLRVEVTTSDSDGVAGTVARKLPHRSEESGLPITVLLYMRVGRLAAPIGVALLADGAVIDRMELRPGRMLGDSAPTAVLPATGELIVQIGAPPVGLSDAYPERDAADGSLARRIVSLAEVDSLPTDWFGYEGVDVLVLATGDVDFCRRLADDRARFEALGQWLELGGRLVVSCGRNAPQLLGEGGPLASLAPGTFVELVRLPQSHSLENFAGTETPIGLGGAPAAIPVPQLADVRGRVDVYGRGSDLPLVVREARGFGELLFVGIDLDVPPVADWAGRPALLRGLLRPYVAEADLAGTSQVLVSTGYSDLAGALRQRLGRSFPSVVPLTFPIVTGLVLVYLLLLGPLDYWFVHKMLRRPWVAWVTFPAIVLVTCGGAALVADLRTGGSDRRVNRVELVDVDLATGLTRGTAWATLYSPDARQFDVALAPRLPDGRTPEHAAARVSFFGLAGSGLGGMHAVGMAPDVAGTGYRWSDELDALLGLPILTSSTKSLAARWEAAPWLRQTHDRSEGARPLLAADLAVDDDGVLVGELTNHCGARLTDALLLHGLWGCRLPGNLEPGQRIEVGPQRYPPIRVNTLLSSRARPSAAARSDGTDRAPFIADRATLDELLAALMFYEAVGGYALTGVPSRYHASCDLSRLLGLDRAILVAGVDADGSPWIDRAAGEPLDGQRGESLTVYRFIIPLQRP